MTQSLVDPTALVADAVDAASPAAAAGSTPDPSAAIAAPPLPSTAGPSTGPPPLVVPEPPPLLAATEGGAAPPPPVPTMLPTPASAPGRGTQLLQQLTAILPQIATMAAASRMSPGGGAGLMEGFVRGHQAALAEKMQRDEFEQHKQQQAATFVEHAMSELTNIASTLGPEAYAQAVSTYDDLGPSFGLPKGFFSQRAATINSSVVSEKQREKLQVIYEKALKNMPEEMSSDERAKAMVQVPGLGPMSLGHLAVLAGQPTDPKTGAAIVPGGPMEATTEKQYLRAYAQNLHKNASQLTPAEVLDARAQFEARSQKPSQTPEEQALRAYATGLGKTVDQLTNDEHNTFLQKRAAASKDPTMASLAQQTAEVNLALKKIQEGQQPTREDASAVAKQIINHQLAPSQLTLFGGGMGTAGAAFKRMVGAEAIKLDPAFNWEEAESTFALAKSPAFQSTVRFMDSVRESLPRLQASAQTLANGNIRGINALLNAGKDQVNNVSLKKFQTDRLFVADEVAKILQGGGTGSSTSDAKLAQASSVLKDSDSPQAIAGALEEVQALIGFRRKALTRGTYLEDKGDLKPTGRFNPATGKIEPVK